jgi:hypothetical protein
MHPRNARLIQVGAAVFWVASILLLVALVLYPAVLNFARDPELAGQAGDSSGVSLASLVLIAALIANMFGAFGLYAYLWHGDLEGAGFVALILISIGNALLLPVAGIYAFVAPHAIEFAARGDTTAAALLTASLSGLAQIVGGVGFVALTVGSMIIGIIAWRTRTLPRWGAVAYFAGFLLLLFLLGLPLAGFVALPSITWTLAGLLIGVGGVSIAVSIYVQAGKILSRSAFSART